MKTKEQKNFPPPQIDPKPVRFELIYRICQLFSNIFLSQQIIEQYFQPWLIS